MGAWISCSCPPGSWNSSRMRCVSPKPRSQSAAVSPVMPPPRIRASVVSADILSGSGGTGAATLRLRHEERALLHPAHLETEMPGADRDLDRSGLEVPLDRVGHGLGEALLQSRHAGKLTHQPRDGADPTDPVARHVHDRGRAEVGDEVVRAHAVDRDALESNRLARRALVARGAKGTGLAPEPRGALRQEIRGELRRDGVLGIPARIDAHRAKECRERRDRLGTGGRSAPRVRRGLPVGGDFLLVEVLLVDHDLLHALLVAAMLLVAAALLRPLPLPAPAALPVSASAAPVRPSVVRPVSAPRGRRLRTRLLRRILLAVLREPLAVARGVLARRGQVPLSVAPALASP